MKTLLYVAGGYLAVGALAYVYYGAVKKQSYEPILIYAWPLALLKY